MKKSEMTVSMPMTTFDEFMELKRKYSELQDELKSCFDTTAFDSGLESFIDFDVKKALDTAKKTLSIKYNGVYINYNV